MTPKEVDEFYKNHEKELAAQFASPEFPLALIHSDYFHMVYTGISHIMPSPL
jgi:hypothetical protein